MNRIFLLLILLISGKAWGQHPFTYLADFKEVAFYGFADSAGNTKTIGLYNLVMQPKEGLCRVQAGRKTKDDYENTRYGFCKPNGTVVVPPIYHNAEDFSEGLALVAKGSKENYFTVNKWGFIDAKGTERIYPQYKYAKSFASGLAPVATDDKKWQYIDKTGAVKIAGPFYNADVFSDGLAAAAEEYEITTNVKSFRVGYVNTNGTWAVKPQTGWVFGHPFVNGRAVVATSSIGESGSILIDRTGKVLSKKYLVIRPRPTEGFYAVKLSGETLNDLKDVWGLIDRDGKELSGVTFNGYEPVFSEGLTPFVQDKKWGFRDKTGKVIIPAQYAAAHYFSEGLAAVKPDEKGPVGFINMKGMMVIKPQYTSLAAFSEGLVAVSIGKDAYDRERKTGVIDKTGKVVIPFDSHGIGAFKNGRALASKDYIDYYIDKTGKTTLAADLETLKQTRYAIQSLGRNDPASAAAILKKLEGKNYPVADYFLGYILLYSKAPLQDPVKGKTLVMAAAAARHPEAMYLAGLVNGTAASPDYAKALEWLLKAEAAGVQVASKDIGVLYEKGLGMTADPAKAATYYGKAAEAGDPASMFNLAMLYVQGKGVAKNEALANNWISKAAQLNYQPAKEYQARNLKK